MEYLASRATTPKENVTDCNCYFADAESVECVSAPGVKFLRRRRRSSKTQPIHQLVFLSYVVVVVVALYTPTTTTTRQVILKSTKRFYILYNTS